jgi:nucleotide-binding universal stress UspA family protein
MKRFSNILFVAEAGVDDTRALTRALELAEHSQARLTVVGTIDFGHSSMSQNLRDAMIREREEELDRLVSRVSGANKPLEVELLVGKPFIEIIREVLRNERDLVVKSLANPGLVTVRGTDKRLLRKCPCPVWIIHPQEEHTYRQILLALDYEPENPENEPLNRQLVEMAASLALSEFAQLHIVHAWRLEHEGFLRSARSGLTRAEVDQMVEDEENRRRKWLETLVGDYCRPLGSEASDYLAPTYHLIQGHAEDVVPKCATDIDAELVVMGTVGRSGIPGLVIGNTAEVILNTIDCSVMAVKPAGFASPVTLDDNG